MASEAEVDLIINATRALPELERDLSRIVTIAENGAPDVDVQAALDLTQSIDSLNRDLDRAVAAAAAGAADIDLDAVLDQQRTLRRLRGDLTRVTAAATTGATVDPVTLQGVLNGPETLRTVRGQLQRVAATAQATAPDIRIGVRVDDDSLRKVDDSTNRLSRSALSAVGALGGLGRSLGTAGAAAGTAAPLLAGVVTAVENLLPASAVATTGLLALQSASGAVNLAMIGVADAIETAFDPEATPEDLAKALAKLAPEAKAFVTELQGMQTELRALQQGVQNRFFQGFDDSLRDLARAVLPDVQRSLNASAVSLNRMALGASAAAATLGSSGVLGTALKSANAGLTDLERIPGQAVTAFGQLAAAAGPSFERITTAAARLADKVSASLSRAFESGALEDAIDGAIDLIAQLGRIAGNVFEILGNVMDAAAQDGEGLFSVLETITGAIAKATGTKEFQDALGALSDVMSEIGKQIAPLLIKALEIIGPVITELAPPVKEIVKILGEQFGRIMEELGPVLVELADAFGKLLVALEPVLPLFGDLVVALLPALVPLFETLGRVFELMAPFIKEFAENLGGQLVPILEKIAPILEEILPKFLELAERIFPQLTEILAELQPAIADLSEAFADLLVELAPLIAKFIEFAISLLDEYGPTLKEIARVITVIFGGAIRLASDTIHETIIPAVRTIKNLLSGDFSGALEGAKTVAVNFASNAARGFENFKERATDALQSAVVTTANNARNIGLKLLEGVASGVTRSVSQILSLPGRFAAAFPNAANLLYGRGVDVVRGLINGMLSQLSRVRSIAAEIGRTVARAVAGALSINSPSKVMMTLGGFTMDGFVKGIHDSMPDLLRQLDAVSAAVPDALPAQTDSGRMVRPQVAYTPPPVFVTIGNEAVDRYVTVRIDERQAAFNRVAAQGVRF
ncbi:hypothetical protein ACFRKB_11520 [Streptomyces scopuliridis]|uniref:phage tail protein n=1 Tax=Streptomyces scopuliridis TaxID=452529 RepID=UPI00369A4036